MKYTSFCSFVVHSELDSDKSVDHWDYVSQQTSSKSSAVLRVAVRFEMFKNYFKFMYLANILSALCIRMGCEGTF